MLGYGNMAALVNDPRVIAGDVVGPGGLVGADAGQQQQQEPPGAGANCVVSQASTAALCVCRASLRAVENIHLWLVRFHCVSCQASGCIPCACRTYERCAYVYLGNGYAWGLCLFRSNRLIP